MTQKLHASLTAAILILTLVSCSDNKLIPAPSPTSTSVPTAARDNSGTAETAGASAASASVNGGESLINTGGNTVCERIKVPGGFVRIDAEEDSFGHYLRTLPLKPDGTEIRLYNGQTKNSASHAAVLDIDVGDRDLQQCADAVMRLRAEYLYGRREFDRIHFNFTSGFKVDFATWMKGNSIKVEGNEVRWVNNPASSDDYSSFRKYLNMVFAYAGTLSLSKELESVTPEDMSIGDVFIKGGTPGHAVIVLDMARNEATGEKIFIIAQSYMPAQDIHILKNPGNDEISPWYPVDFGNTLETPDWSFGRSELMRFGE